MIGFTNLIANCEKSIRAQADDPWEPTITLFLHGRANGTTKRLLGVKGEIVSAGMDGVFAVFDAVKLKNAAIKAVEVQNETNTI